MKAIAEKDWTPAAGLHLERNALRIVTAPVGNSLVVAGPGAGKTELLAQRGCFLLQTNLCQYPHRILAISFKRDAAYNLKDRVTLRAGTELSNRFDSYTYDSFAKQLVDRFKTALPDEYSFNDQYEIIFDDDIIDIYRSIDPGFINTNDRNGIKNAFTESALPLPKHTAVDQLRHQVWMRALTGRKLTFRMVMRLAELIINTNPTIKSYLQTTYDYIFLDEFQDTTTAQYDFLNACFGDSNKVLTAVGDDKQQIMLWAGARKTIFQEYITKFGAEKIPLKMNFRSAPLLVKVQNSLIKSLLGKDDLATPRPDWKGTEGECIIWEFSNQNDEAAKLASTISHWIANDGLKPREVCILVKGKLETYVGELIKTLRASGVKARDESIYQDFLTDEVILYLIHSMYLVIGKGLPESRRTVFDFLSRVNNELSDQLLIRLENRLSKFIKTLREDYEPSSIGKDEIRSMLKKLIEYANPERIRAVFPHYKQRAYLTKVLQDFEKHLISYVSTTSSFEQVLDYFRGVDTVPVMTVHKSKGLEYDTVIFVGLEDGAFWSFSKQPDEDKATFFVALSRAKMRVVFTFSNARDGLYRTKQSRDNIKVIFDELKRAGVKSETF